MSTRISVELVLAMPERQVLLCVDVDDGATVADVIAASRIAELFPDVPLDTLATGIWGRPTETDRVVRNGDRIEFYRPLRLDPREARRKLASAGRSIGQMPQPGKSRDPG